MASQCQKNVRASFARISRISAKEKEELKMKDTRKFNTSVYGDDALELELNAMMRSREFFGDDIRLRVRPDYSACKTINTSEPKRKEFCASVVVEVAGTPLSIRARRIFLRKACRE